jgi:alpha-ketoglutaric semialdehyde dehydrogenase
VNITGENLVAGLPSSEGGIHFRGIDPRTHMEVEPLFTEATGSEVDRAVTLAVAAFPSYSRVPASTRAAFLRAIADELIALGAELVDRAHLETALPIPRLEGERARTAGQLRLFASLLDEGSWVDARIDRGDASRAPLPKPDLRRMLVPLGPVAVFGASNFPFAFSVPGGDTASALASGCTVVCKGHPAHPGTSELAARAIDRAAVKCGLDRGVFSLLHGWSHEVGLAIVRHPGITAVGFTGSLRGGRALFDAAAARPSPIPVYAEMGSVNPVFLLPSAVKERGVVIAQGLATSITMGTGQFCTNPGVIVGVRDASLDALEAVMAERINAMDASVMLYPQLAASYGNAVARAEALGASVTARGQTDDAHRSTPALLRVDASQFVAQEALRDEMFGPVSIVVGAGDLAEMERVAEALEGQLTATIHGTPAELREHRGLVEILQRKVGRLLFNGYPTGVEVGHAMQHGGPYPASTDSRSTSVGSAAIARFVRPLCYQDFPADALPEDLRDENARGIWRLVDGSLTRERIS